ncbi:nuclear transport factor 2 family protein [Sphaerisporangium sp. TRM90804]|uniref:nuclear transport factor 2 family protein n=1 Tax=Sphaerisporangium sp. TRM90804 TaxID=3031113 RepID=UPI00244C4903|nr:nuclear transport factor 2 family protein [Sphaerisporangium sp. TRM90804]MDH2428393.1 nuclear transport factor 2 family protein [Sphaerisporangium sp. TRM90804]
MNPTQTVALDALPAAITAYLAAHRHDDIPAQLSLFAADATVVDDGHTHTGLTAIAAWADHSAGAYTYTITPIAAERPAESDGDYTVTQHLAGDFPGGTVDLRFRFTLLDGLIRRLVIEP